MTSEEKRSRDTRIFDVLNEKYYTRKALIKESIKNLIDGGCADTKQEALELAKQYVEENSIPASRVKQWRKDNQ